MSYSGAFLLFADDVILLASLNCITASFRFMKIIGFLNMVSFRVVTLLYYPFKKEKLLPNRLITMNGRLHQ